MKKVTIFLSILVVLSSIPSFLFSQNLNHLNLIAHYPLSSTANDTTGNYGPALLINTPFQDGGVYCNGNYVGTDPDPADITTPYLTGLSFSSFAISAEFKVKECPLYNKPVVVGGASWRWVSAWVQSDSTIGFSWDDGWPKVTNVKYTPNIWHTVTMVYDSTTRTAKGYLEGVLADSTSNVQLNHGNDKILTISHGRNGSAFKGYIKNIKIYSITNNTNATFKMGVQPTELGLAQNYPNPFNPETTIQYALPHADFIRLAIYNLKGQRVVDLVNQFQNAGYHSVIWDGTNTHGVMVSSGVYICRIQTGNRIITQKMILNR